MYRYQDYGHDVGWFDIWWSWNNTKTLDCRLRRERIKIIHNAIVLISVWILRKALGFVSNCSYSGFRDNIQTSGVCMNIWLAFDNVWAINQLDSKCKEANQIYWLSIRYMDSVRSWDCLFKWITKKNKKNYHDITQNL